MKAPIVGRLCPRPHPRGSLGSASKTVLERRCRRLEVVS